MPARDDTERTLTGRAVRPELRRIPVGRMRPRTDQPRQHIDREGLEELTESIRRHGVLQPVRVRPSGEGFEIIAGERRWRAARRAGLQEIPAIVVEADDDRAYVEALVENIQREELNAVDRAHALTRLRTTLDLGSWQQVAEMVGITRQHVYNILNVTRLPEAMRDDIRAGALTEKHARALLRLRARPERQQELWEEIHTRLLSGRAAEERAREMVEGTPAAQRPAAAAPPAGLASLATDILAALLTAAPGELDSARSLLVDLHRRVGRVLERPGH